jgi:hypothetical protein
MPMRLKEEEERPFAPFGLVLAGALAGLIGYDLIFWSRAIDHPPTIAHTPGYGAVLLILWLCLSWVSRDPWLRTAWRVLALNEMFSIMAAVYPTMLPWWRGDALVLVSCAAVCAWGWRHSPGWVRLIAAVLLALGGIVGQGMLNVERRPPIVRSTQPGKAKPR